MAVYARGELVWARTAPEAPRWVLVLHDQPRDAPDWLDPQDFTTPQTASSSQLAALVSQTLYRASGQRPMSITLTPVQYRQRLRFYATF